MKASGAEWLCLESFTGMFILTEWGWMSMEEKVAALERVIGEAASSVPLSGVVLCSGVSHFDGTVEEERHETPTATIGIRYPVVPWRAREPIIIPLHEHARHTAHAWRMLFDSERDWLNWAMVELKLPSVDEMLSTEHLGG